MHSPSSFSDSSSGSFFSTFFFFGFGGSIIGDCFSCFISGVFGDFCSSLPAEVPGFLALAFPFPAGDSLPAEVPGFLDLAFPFPAGFRDLLLFPVSGFLFPVSGFLTMAADTACFEGCF